SGEGTISSRKKRFEASDEVENREPALWAGPGAEAGANWSSLLRLTEQEVKPDTPAIPSVRSRIQRLQEITVRGRSLDGEVEELGGPKPENAKDESAWAELEADAKNLSAEGSSVCTVLELGDGHGDGELLPIGHSTMAPHRAPLPSLETAGRLRKERQEELAMVSSVVDHSNPWRAQSMRRKKRRLEELITEGPPFEPLGDAALSILTLKVIFLVAITLDSDAAEISLEDSDCSLDVPRERCVSSLEVRLRRPGSFGSPSPKKPPTLCDSVDGERPKEDGAEDDAQRRVTMNSSEIIDRIFEGVLDVSDVSQDLDMELPPVSILSPLTKSADLQAALSPLGSVVSSLPELLEEELPVTPAKEEFDLPHSIDTYRTLRKNLQKEGRGQLCTPTNSRTQEKRKAELRPPDLKERIKVLNQEVSALQRVMEQSCRALSCCVDVEHGKGTRQEAEAERLLLVSAEKRKAILRHLDRLREYSGSSESSAASGKMRPCRASVTISNIQLPLKVDYVCTALRDSGSQGHYFLILIRYGSHDVVATPLASAADAQTGDTIIFPTTVTLNDADADFRIEVEVYSMTQSRSVLSVDKRKSLKPPKITPKKLLPSR
ncbi:anillin-like, partial [Gastrophryne carolinensis]